jgi:hypothetical protein
MPTQTERKAVQYARYNRLNQILLAVGQDVERYLDDPVAYLSGEYFPEVLELIREAQELGKLLREDLKITNQPRGNDHEVS